MTAITRLTPGGFPGRNQTFASKSGAIPSINNLTVPSSMATRGNYRFSRQRAGTRNGNGIALAAGPQMLEWQFPYMTQTEMDWWYTTIMAGEPSAELEDVRIVDDRMLERSFSEGTLYRPQFGSHTAGIYWNVTVIISHLLPLL